MNNRFKFCNLNEEYTEEVPGRYRARGSVRNLVVIQLDKTVNRGFRERNQQVGMLPNGGWRAVRSRTQE